MNTEDIIKLAIEDAVFALWQQKPAQNSLQIQKTKKEFIGDLTVVVFPLLKISSKKPEDTANDLGLWLKQNCSHVSDFNVVKGFLNIVLNQKIISDTLLKIDADQDFGFTSVTEQSKKIVLEFSSPNTNKPLHLGHMRNNFLGESISRILKAGGNNVIKVNLVNDRGIHICKSMLAMQKWGNGQTPENSSIKGDHLVGNYYVMFDKYFRQEVKSLLPENFDQLDEEAQKKAKADAEAKSSLMNQARLMLKKWEDGDKETVDLWKTMNSWVYAGFDQTYKLMDISFDKIYHESETYLEGKSYVLEALNNGICKKDEDNSVFIDLTADGLDKKILLRRDGTTVYMTQDLGTAAMRHREFNFDDAIYVVGNEQDYHFKVLKLVLKKMGFDWADNIRHFSYGMVELPAGKMKSREGTVVDADDLIAEMTQTAFDTSSQLGKFAEMSDREQKDTSFKIAMAALKYFILKVDPKKNMMYDPKESIDFNGNTGPFILYTYARIRSIFRKLSQTEISRVDLLGDFSDFSQPEADLVKYIADFPKTIQEACSQCSPAKVANYVYDLCKLYNQFYHDYKILSEEDSAKREFRLTLSRVSARIIKKCMYLLGIEVIEKM